MKQPKNYVIFVLAVLLCVAAGLLWQKNQEAAAWKMRAGVGETRVAQLTPEQTESLTKLLSESGYAQYQAYDQNIASGNSPIRVQRVLANTPEVLTEEQSTQLELLLLRADGNGRISPRVIDAAKGFLSPAQVQALEQTRALQQANDQNRRNAALPLAATGH